MTPILSGLILSVPLTMLTSRTSAGRWMRRRGLLLTPEETNTPAELHALEERMAAGALVSAGQGIDLPAPALAAPAPAVTFAPVNTMWGGTTLVRTVSP